MKYIDADKLKKIVEQAKQRALKGTEVDDDLYCDGRADAFGEVLLEIDSLQQEQPEGLDEAAEKSAKSWRKNPDGSESREMLFQPHIRGFKAGAEWMAGQFEKNRLDALRKVKALRDAQNMHAKTLNYGYRCLAIRLGKEVDEMLDKLKIK